MCVHYENGVLNVYKMVLFRQQQIPFSFFLAPHIVLCQMSFCARLSRKIFSGAKLFTQNINNLLFAHNFLHFRRQTIKFFYFWVYEIFGLCSSCGAVERRVWLPMKWFWGVIQVCQTRSVVFKKKKKNIFLDICQAQKLIPPVKLLL